MLPALEEKIVASAAADAVSLVKQVERDGLDIRLSRKFSILNEVADPDLGVLVGSGPGLNIND